MSEIIRARGLVEGDMHWSHLGNLAAAIVFAGMLFALAIWSMRRRLVK